MKKAIAKWLGIDTVYKIVEVPAPHIVNQSDPELREAITTLSAHPGFVALCSRLAITNAALKSKLTHERHTKLDDVNFLQAGVYWSNWLKQEVARATVKVSAKQVDPMEEELSAFKELDSQLERVGE